MPFKKCGNAVPQDRLVFDVEAAHDCTAHQSTATGGGEEERHRALLHGAATLAGFEVAAVVLGLPEAFVKLSCRRFAFDSNQRQIAVMEQVIEFQQTIAERVFDLELWPTR